VRTRDELRTKKTSGLAACADYRDKSTIQFTAQLLPPSGEKDCSIRADFGVRSDQT